MEKVKKITALIICGAMLIQALGLMTPSVYGAENIEEDDTPAETGTVASGVDTSNMSFEVEKSSITDRKLKIKNVKITDTGSYTFKMKVTNTQTKPAESNFSEMTTQNGWNLVIYDQTSNSFNINIEDYLELNNESYIWIYGYDGVSQNIIEVVSGEKLEHEIIPKDSRLFFASFLADYTSQIVINAPLGWNSNRKCTYKIGEINDNGILNDIKDEKSDGFDSLLNYAKQSDYVSTGSLNVKHGSTESKKIDLDNKLTDGKYYYIYCIFDDENGKYYPIEGVTLGKASVYSGRGWDLPLYGDKDFNWDNFESGKAEPNGGETTQADDGKKDDGKKDDTVAKDPIPQTGQTAIITIAVILALAGMGALIKYKNIQLK